MYQHTHTPVVKHKQTKAFCPDGFSGDPEHITQISLLE